MKLYTLNDIIELNTRVSYTFGTKAILVALVRNGEGKEMLQRKKVQGEGLEKGKDKEKHL